MVKLVFGTKITGANGFPANDTDFVVNRDNGNIMRDLILVDSCAITLCW